MTWKNVFHAAVKKETEPMRQITYWVIFISCAVSTALLTISTASAASYEMIQQNPEIASSSWLSE